MTEVTPIIKVGYRYQTRNGQHFVRVLKTDFRDPIDPTQTVVGIVEHPLYDQVLVWDRKGHFNGLTQSEDGQHGLDLVMPVSLKTETPPLIA